MGEWTTIAVSAATIGLASAGVLYIGYRLGKRRVASKKSYLVSDDAYRYLSDHNIHDPILMKLRAVATAHTRGIMASTLEAEALLTQLTRALGARKCIDVGVFMGCSSYAMALGLPSDGRVVACDVSTDYTSQGKPFWVEGGVANKIDLRIQPANQTLQELIDNGESGTFDLVFIDADKTGYVGYYEFAVQLLRPGGLIVVDNTLKSGHVYDPTANDENTVAIRKMNDRMTNDDRVFSVQLNFADGIGIAQKL